MKVIGLTGGIGSGKSTVSQFLAEMGAVVIDADKVGHEAFKPDTELWHQVVAAFGKHILKPSNEIDRKRLGETVFGNPELLSRLNKIMHPRMYDAVRAQIKDYQQQGAEVVVLEAPLLVEGEGEWVSLVDEIWVTVASEATVLKRLRGRSQMSGQEALARIRSQLPSEERIRYADMIIDTECSLSKLKARVKKLWDKLHTDKRGG
jgi:dephospho-CoA kinase